MINHHDPMIWSQLSLSSIIMIKRAKYHRSWMLVRRRLRRRVFLPCAALIQFVRCAKCCGMYNVAEIVSRPACGALPGSPYWLIEADVAKLSWCYRYKFDGGRSPPFFWGNWSWPWVWYVYDIIMIYHDNFTHDKSMIMIFGSFITAIIAVIWYRESMNCKLWKNLSFCML